VLDQIDLLHQRGADVDWIAALGERYANSLHSSGS
jgi:hypothetical protein